MLPGKDYRNGEVVESAKKKLIRCFLFCTAGGCIMAFNLNSFVDTGNLFPGGFAGVALLIIRCVEKYMGVIIPYSLVYIPLNLIPIYIGVRYLGRRFTIFSCYVILLSSVLTDLLPKVPITYDVLLISVFGGIINGAAISACLFVGASGGGTDFISIFFSEQKGIDAWNYIFVGNVVILTAAGILFGWDKALYSIIYQFCTTQVIHTLFKRYEKHTLIIISDKPEAISAKIGFLTHHDATIFTGQGYYSHQRKSMIYSIVSTEEVNLVVHAVREIDPHAFINILKTERLVGRFHRTLI